VLTQERKDRILEQLRRDGSVLAQGLSAAFQVSEDTVRRDLRELAAAGLLKRVYGGALPLARASVLDVKQRARESVGEKRALATAAARLVEPGEVILVDGGTTNCLFAQALPPELSVTIITTSPAVALSLCNHPHVEIVLTGGKLLKRSGTSTGPGAVDALRAVRADLAVLGVCSLDADLGITCAEMDEMYVKRAMLEAAGEVIAICTSDKIDSVSTHVVAPVTAITRLVTSAAVPEKSLGRLAERGVEVLRVAVGAP